MKVKDEKVDISELRKEIIIALFSDDDLLDILVFKGGNAIDLIYKLSSRASVDLDFSISNKFNEDELIDIKDKIKNTLEKHFSEKNITVFDLKFEEKPKDLSDDLKSFWGGYKLEFKLINSEKAKNLEYDIVKMARNAINIGNNNSTKCKIDISKFEYCDNKKQKSLDNLEIYVYTPEMIVFEKIRAICQQLPNYKSIVGTHNPRARARDFFDIYIVSENFKIDFVSDDNIELLKNIFSAKRVPILWINKIVESKEFHKSDWNSVIDTIPDKESIKELNYDFYFDYLVQKIELIREKIL